jgi:hypothetical protein
MSTTQWFYKEVPDPKRPGKTRHLYREVTVPHCPMFDFDNANERVPEYIQAIADGFTPSGHRVLIGG